LLEQIVGLRWTLVGGDRRLGAVPPEVVLMVVPLRCEV
jgi:hypothetical protein